jgi:uncharacterized membrane protein YccC
VRSVRGARLTEAVPDWLVEVVRPKRAPVPWPDMARAVLAIWIPLAVGFAAGHRNLGLLPAMGGLMGVMVDSGGPYWARVRRVTCAAVFGGAAGLAIGSLIHGRGWVAVLALVVMAGVSSILPRFGGTGSVTGLQLFVYASLGLGPIGALRPAWHTALLFGIGVVWALLLLIPGWLLAPRAAEQRLVAAVYHSLADALRAIGTPRNTAAWHSVTAALNSAYNALLTWRASSSGRSQRGTHLTAILNVSHRMAEAAAALRTAGERPPPGVTQTIDRLAEAIAAERREQPPLIPPPWSGSAGARALRESMLALARAVSGSWTPVPAAPPARGHGALRAQVQALAARVRDQLIGGRLAWLFTIRLMVCTGVAAVMSEVLPLQRSYWVLLTVGIVLKPDYGSVFARALQRGIGTVVGAFFGAAILAVVPYGPWLLVPFGVLAALLPYGKSRSFGLSAMFLTPLVVVLIDLLTKAGWPLAGARLVDTLLGCGIVLVFGYAAWPGTWRANLSGQFPATLRVICDYADEALVSAWAEVRHPAPVTGHPPAHGAGHAPALRSRLRRHAYESLSDLRTEYQRTMSEPAAISRRASAWWPAVTGLEELMDAVTATAVAIGGGAPVPSPAAVRQLTGTLRASADVIAAGGAPTGTPDLPEDEALAPVTGAVRSVLATLTPRSGRANDPSG